MAYQKKIVLHCPNGYRIELDAMVDDFVRDGVAYVGVVGQDCSKVEDIIDELLVGDGLVKGRFILTASHPGESIDDAVYFAKSLTGEFNGKEVQLVEF
jgi:hypothetical protein